MPPKKATKKPTKKSTSTSDKKITFEKGVAISENSDLSDISSDSDIESKISEELEENFDEIEDDDLLGDNDNEIEDEDKTEESEEESDEEVEKEDDKGDVEKEDIDDECLYRFSKNKNGLLDDEDDFDAEEEYFLEDDVPNDNEIFVANDKRITKPVLTKYERVRVLGERARQLSLGAKPMVKGALSLEPKEIAKLELQMGMVPLIIIRTLPSGKKEKWRIDELKIVN